MNPQLKQELSKFVNALWKRQKEKEENCETNKTA